MPELRLNFPLEPVPASRPRFTRFGKPYYGKNYTKFRKQAAAYLGSSEFKDELKSRARLPLVGGLRLTVVFTIGRPKTTKRRWPGGDVDNYLKTLDVFNGILWLDDDQITTMTGVKTFGTTPGISLTVEYDENQQQVCSARTVPKLRFNRQPRKIR
jgi:Holliday junction resolvase RusA-like endonuclease